jgi:hypothetical protein
MSDRALPSPKHVDRLAILTFALAALWLFGIGSVAALYVGRQSLRGMRVRPGVRGRTLAWAGIAVAVYGLAMTTVWVGLTLAA